MSPDYGINYAIAKIYIWCTMVLGILPSLCGIQAVHSLGLSIKICCRNANCIPIGNLSFRRGEKFMTKCQVVHSDVWRNILTQSCGWKLLVIS